jgi:hypothetical protein
VPRRENLGRRMNEDFLLIINIATAPCSCRRPVGRVVELSPVGQSAHTKPLTSRKLLPPFSPFGYCSLPKRSGVLSSTTHAQRRIPSTKPRATDDSTTPALERLSQSSHVGLLSHPAKHVDLSHISKSGFDSCAVLTLPSSFPAGGGDTDPRSTVWHLASDIRYPASVSSPARALKPHARSIVLQQVAPSTG